MKKIIVFLLLCLSVNVSAQSVFGIDVNTTNKKFCLQMLKKGYKPYEKVSQRTKFKVTYAGYTKTDMEILYDDSNGMIREVEFFFKNRSNDENQQIFDNLEAQFRKKYDSCKRNDLDIDVINSHLHSLNIDLHNGGYITLGFNIPKNELWVSYIAKYNSTTKSDVKPNKDI